MYVFTSYTKDGLDGTTNRLGVGFTLPSKDRLGVGYIQIHVGDLHLSSLARANYCPQLHSGAHDATGVTAPGERDESNRCRRHVVAVRG